MVCGKTVNRDDFQTKVYISLKSSKVIVWLSFAVHNFTAQTVTTEVNYKTDCTYKTAPTTTQGYNY